MAPLPLVITRPHYLESEDCGYCKCAKPPRFNGRECTHITIGCSVEQVTCAEYDQFINMGFRRSGTFLYKGDMLRGCCRMYTIRTTLDQIQVTKEHRQVCNRFKRAIGGPNETRSDGSSHKRPVPFQWAHLLEAEQRSSRFHTRFEPASYSDEKYALYKKYQVTVHNDDPDEVTPKQFLRFLCELPFPDAELAGTPDQWTALNTWASDWVPGSRPKAPQHRRIGPTHELYYLDEKLIAISVMDFLPSGVSSVYLIWDPDYAHLSLGTLSALREVLMCRELQLGHYYLGYYIEDCAKMRYKGKFGGELLDVCNEAYAPLDAVRPMLENDKFWVNGKPDGGDLAEPFLQLSGEPVTEPIVADCYAEMYGNEKLYAQAEQAEAKLKEYGYWGMVLPAVLPGAVPLPQLVTWLADGLLDGELPLAVFDTTTYKMRHCELGGLLQTQKAAVVDFIRLFGLKRAMKSIIIL